MKARHLHHTGGPPRDQDRQVSTTLVINTPGLRHQGLDEGEQGWETFPAQPPDHLVGRRLSSSPQAPPCLGSHLCGLRPRQLGRASASMSLSTTR
ncbi:hypothetical protein E1265_15385 [Streptomyces sp. 8K308]|nr:hypothetical protein E1265_15385 [Streptomyces sp. 8K308]